MPKTRKDLVPGTLDLLVLRVLSSGARHGYGIARQIQLASQDVLRVEEGSLYPALHRLERQGLVSASWGVSESNRRAKWYAITPSGRRQLKTERASWERMAAAVERVLVDPEAGEAPA